MRRVNRTLLSISVLVLLGTSACSLPGFGSSKPVDTPTPMGDTLTFMLPAYSLTLQPGETVPGTRLHYVGRAGDTYEVRIDGLAATKRAGDSFIWNGVLAPGVHADFNLRLISAIFGPLSVAGPVNITVFNPDPFEQPVPDALQDALTYNNVLVNYLVPEGREIPGSTLRYDGITSQGEGEQASRLARMEGLRGYPYVALGDSLAWSGRLRGNVYLQYALRVAALNENGLRVAGTAKLWIVTRN